MSSFNRWDINNIIRSVVLVAAFGTTVAALLPLAMSEHSVTYYEPDMLLHEPVMPSQSDVPNLAVTEPPPETTAAPIDPLPGYPHDFIATLTEEERAEAEYFYDLGYVFYRQSWSPLTDLQYGPVGFDFGECGCGPTCVAAIISNLAGVPVTPAEMREYAIDNHYVASNGGTAHLFMTSVPEKYGIKVSYVYSGSEALVREALSEGKLVLAVMGPGDFTLGSHFMLFRGITDEGKILIADSYSFEFSAAEWDYDYLYAQLKSGYWIYEMPSEDEDIEADETVEGDNE